MTKESNDFSFDVVIAMLERLANGFQTRVAGWGQAGVEWDRLASAIVAELGSIGYLLFGMAFVFVVTTLGQVITTRTLRRLVSAKEGFLGSLVTLMGLCIALVIGITCALLLARGSSPAKFSFSAMVLAAALGTLIWSIHSTLLYAVRGRDAHDAAPTIRRLAMRINLAFSWALAGSAIHAALGAWGSGAGLRDLFGTFGVGVPVLAFICLTIFTYRRHTVGLVGGRRPRSAARGAMARAWPGLVIVVLNLLYLSGQIALVAGRPLPSMTLGTAALALLILPYLDALLRSWGMTAQGIENLPVTRAALRMTARPAAVASILAVLLTIWLAPVYALIGTQTGRLGWLAVEIAIIGLVSALAWNIVTVLSDRARNEKIVANNAEEEAGQPQTRFQTLAPLLAATAKAIIATLAILSALVALGISVWPIITGFSVFGLAIGLGSQTLIKDIVSGLFYLGDDAFRMGEYIETAGSKGTIEKISVRSVSLRHPRGPLATIPYGSIGRVVNFSRDYAIEKIAFRVAMDTDVEKLRKIFKAIGLEQLKDPELAGDLLEPFKSQGIAEIEDGTLVVRGKFKAKAGRQHLIRRKVLLAVHDAFLENNIEVVARPMMPPAHP